MRISARLERAQEDDAMANLTEPEARLLAQVSADRLWQHAQTIAQLERTSGTPGELAAVDYLQGQLERYGLTTRRYEFPSLLGWPESASVEVSAAIVDASSPSAVPQHLSFHAITHAFTPSTPADGVEATVVYLGTGEEADFA